MIESIYNKVKISLSHFEGLTVLFDVNLECADSTCRMDCSLDAANGKLLDNNSFEIKPDYFVESMIGQTLYSFQPMKPDVTNLIIGIELKNFSGNEKTLYKFSYDIYTNSISIGKNIDVQFDCSKRIINR